MTQGRSTAKSGGNAASLEPPPINEDAAERKRILNVLAQRRYRQRKRDHVASLESQIQRKHSKAVAAPVENLSSDQEVRNCDYSTDSSSTDSGLSAYFPDPILFPDTQTANLFNVSSGLSPETEFTFSPLLGFPSPPSDLSSRLQMQQSTTYTFPDDKYINVPELCLIRACLAIATRLNISHLIMDLTSLSPFTSPKDPNVQSLIPALPENLRPTRVQSSLPHHPILDILPWPTVRNKLISTLSLPIDIRPPQAAGATALLELVYDMEDPTEGVRVWGEDPYNDANWEVGQKVFQRWWWALDRPVMARSNQLRQQRGAPPLAPMGRGMIVGNPGGSDL